MLELGLFLLVFFPGAYGAHLMATNQRASDRALDINVVAYTLGDNKDGDLSQIRNKNADSTTVTVLLWVRWACVAIGCIGILLIAAHFMSVIFSSIN